MIENEGFKIWLITVISINFLIIFPLWLINVRCHYKNLKRQKVPKPLFINIKQLGLVRILLLPLSLLPVSFFNLNKLKGRQVWLEWDIRWLTCDSTLAKIEDVVRRANGYALLIRLGRPMKFSSDSILVEKIIFEPNDNFNLIRYYLGAVSGGLIPFEDVPGIKDLISNGRLASCEVVVY